MYFCTASSRVVSSDLHTKVALIGSRLQSLLPIAANPPGFPGNFLDFETCPGIPDLKKNSRILKFVQKKKKRGDHFFDFVRDCGS